MHALQHSDRASWAQYMHAQASPVSTALAPASLSLPRRGLQAGMQGWSGASACCRAPLHDVVAWRPSFAAQWFVFLVAFPFPFSVRVLVLPEVQWVVSAEQNLDMCAPSQGQLARERGQNAELAQHLRQAKQALVRRGQLVEELRTRVCAVVILHWQLWASSGMYDGLHTTNRMWHHPQCRVRRLGGRPQPPQSGRSDICCAASRRLRQGRPVLVLRGMAGTCLWSGFSFRP